VNLVLDASVALSWAFEDERAGYGAAVLEALARSEAVVPHLWPVEVANGLVVAERRGRISTEEATRFARLLLGLPIVVQPVGRSRVLDGVRHLARRTGLSAYDAEYLDLALGLGIPLATLHRPLREAAVAEGVTPFTP